MSLNGGYDMRTFDLSPLYRSTIGFDRLFSLLDQSVGAEAPAAYPPYNIERTGENAYRLTLAVAGFGEAELSIESRENTLTIKGAKDARSDDGVREMLYQGIAGRASGERAAPCRSGAGDTRGAAAAADPDWARRAARGGCAQGGVILSGLWTGALGRARFHGWDQRTVIAAVSLPWARPAPAALAA
jgi:HSP20 family molecular chaperone IbpA